MRTRSSPGGLALLLAMALLSASCREAPSPAPVEAPGGAPAEMLDQARELLAAYDFGPRFREALGLLEEIPQRQGVEHGVALDAFLLRAEALTDLLLAAWVTGDDALAETLEAITSWNLEGALLSTPRNFQILVQEVQELFQLAAREAPAEDPRRARAELMDAFLASLQALVFVKRDVLARDLRRLEEELGGRYADQAAAVLAGELFRPGTRSWRDHVVGTLGLVCPRAVGGLVNALCVPDPASEVKGQCRLDVTSFSEERRAAAGRVLRARCDGLAAEGEGPPLAAIRGVYAARLERLRVSPSPLAAWLRGRCLEAWTAGLDAALAPAFALAEAPPAP
ncbi:MAG: hypothetical protein FJ098_06005 [Deltaproteobacteria bacterium]|nr:hypothetical protein [Deltaproteobacteria bacterium]